MRKKHMYPVMPFPEPEKYDPMSNKDVMANARKFRNSPGTGICNNCGYKGKAINMTAKIDGKNKYGGCPTCNSVNWFQIRWWNPKFTHRNRLIKRKKKK
jgi:hypothetical protein